MKFVLFGNASQKNAAIRYRLVKFAHMLEQDGHDCVVCLPSSIRLWEMLYEGKSRWCKLIYIVQLLFRRVLQLRHVFGAGAVFFRGPVFPYGPTLFERVIHVFNPRMVFDIDDAVWERPAYVTSPFLRFHDFDWVWKMCSMCRHAIVGNSYLEQHISEYVPRVTIIPTCIDTAVHTSKTYPAPDENRPVVLGWTGLYTNLGYMEVVEEPLRALARRYNILLDIASNGEYHLDGVRVVNRVWRLENEAAYLQNPDIGLMPLTETDRAKGKCSFKALEFMAVGTPCVVSPVGMNASIIEDGITGYLARDPAEWYDKLERLIVDPELRKKMGRAARKAVIERYSHEVHYADFRRVLETVAQSSEGTKKRS